VALLPQLMPVEAQLAQYIAGFGQQIAVALITLAPMFDLHRNESYRDAGIGDTEGRAALTRNHSQPEFLH
jgi:hypothetical protein